MPTWNDILKELQGSTNNGSQPPQCDNVRRKYLVALSQHTGRNTILYATRFLESAGAPPDVLSIVPEDLQGIMTVVHGIKGPNLDLVLHSPGGSLEATESITNYLRSKFKNIRVIVPLYAQSAAAMLACSADEIVMGKHSFLGPTDPQIRITNEYGSQFVPAQSILDQFAMAEAACQNPKILPAWVPMLRLYAPHLLVVCENAKKMSKELVEDWLTRYMLKRDRQKKEKADKIATWLSDHRYFKSHGRSISRQELKKRGVKILFLEKDQTFQDLVLSLIHATTCTFDMTPAAKIIENHRGKAFIKIAAQIAVKQAIPTAAPVPRPSRPAIPHVHP